MGAKKKAKRVKTPRKDKSVDRKFTEKAEEIEETAPV